jgi:glutathione-regulated potassium-efflux system ancillary protein KefC
MARHSKAKELANALLSFKDLFLVGFFLSIGMTVLPGWSELLIALIFIVFLPLKVALYYGLFNTFYLRTSTSWRTSLNLANYSEFGLIVGALAASSGWLPKEWLAVFAIALSASFILSAQLVNVRDSLYQNWRERLKLFERDKPLSEEQRLEFSDINIVIFGMGRMGTEAYTTMEEDYLGRLVGVEIEPRKTQRHQDVGRHVVVGDATNPDFWTSATGLLDGLEWVMLTLPSHTANIAAAQQLKQMGYSGGIAATSKFADEAQALKDMGVDLTFNIYAEAGLGLANNLKKIVN